MPSFSATDCAPAAAGVKPVATIASHPSAAAAATASNCAAINSAARQVRGCRRRLLGSHLAHQLAHRLAGRHQSARRHRPAAPRILVRRRAHPHLRAERPQLHRESPPAVRRPRATRTSTTTHAFRDSPVPLDSGLGRRFCGTTGVLPQAPRCAISWEWQGAVCLLAVFFWSALDGPTTSPQAAARRARRHAEWHSPAGGRLAEQA